MKTNCLLPSLALALLTLPALAQRPPPPAAPPPPSAPPAPAADENFGQPLPGLTAAEQADFSAGRADFTAVETVATGLGPIFNNNSCAACHAAPTVGGSSPITVTRFGRTEQGVFDPLTQFDGSLLHAKAIAPVLREVIPPEANTTAQRLTTPLYGAGLIEAIPDAEIERNAQAAKAPGVGGKVALVTDAATGAIRVGRFGWKAQHATLLSFAGDASTNEIGITNRVFPIQPAPDGNVALLATFVSLTSGPKDVADPVTGLAAIDRMANFMRSLAPPAPAPATPAAQSGRQVFARIGCADCHTPALATGPNAEAALGNRNVPLWSDLLLHDMGSLGDGIAQGAAGPTEMRTSPLWGLRARGPFLHDGRAATVDAAIRDHAGEGAGSAANYAQLDATEREDLLAFLATL